MSRRYISFASSLLICLASLFVTAGNASAVGDDLATRPLQWAQTVADAPVSNLHRVTPLLYRSAQLSKDDVPTLQSLGIKKVISFRAFHADDKILAGSNIAMQRIPINTWNIRDQDMVAALKALRNLDQDGPILIHCQHGADRTGLVSALYRVVYQGWTKEQALNELQNGGYGFHAIWQNIKRYLEQVDIDKLRRAVAS
ncbi:dual specificity protein phosphatase family protein [Collimonas sp. NPDC087041]|uniref:dual specificity protein phosphatase family protein n=1 Tax=Collimonas sp. NPDC087041 TaxID=3363960 RepID=UPI00381F09A3